MRCWRCSEAMTGMSDIAQQIVAKHRLSRPMRCECGEWPGPGAGEFWEDSYARHVATMTERAVREHIAADLDEWVREHELMDLYGPYWSGARYALAASKDIARGGGD